MRIRKNDKFSLIAIVYQRHSVVYSTRCLYNKKNLDFVSIKDQYVSKGKFLRNIF